MNPLSSKSSGEEEQRDVAPLVNPSELEDWIIYEDESVVALNKPGWGIFAIGTGLSRWQVGQGNEWSGSSGQKRNCGKALAEGS
jgi:hypothetical protein